MTASAGRLDQNHDVTYEMKLSMNVLNHLGINLYTNLPAVLSEAVANSWDADATRVEIDIDPVANTVTITDNGVGMTPEAINKRYLTVGYQRRQDADNPNGAVTARGRKVMGRKGIGKLSLFSIAKKIEVYSLAETDEGPIYSALELDLDVIMEHIREDGDTTYKPPPIPYDESIAPNDGSGTVLVLRDPRKDLRRTASHLRRRLARRFAVAARDFEIRVDGEAIGPADRDLAKRAQYLWVYGPEDYRKDIAKIAPAGARIKQNSGITPRGDQVQGWIGSALASTDLKPDGPNDESLNRIAILVRSKLAQEDVLEAAALGGMFTKYLSGEINADFLDDDLQADIATSSRQGIVEDDPRYEDLREFLTSQIRSIGTDWSKYRVEDGAAAAVRSVPAIDDWLKTLRGDTKKAAVGFVGRIYAASLDSESAVQLLSSGVIAFEQLQRSNRLSVIETTDDANLPALVAAFSSIDDIEAAQYYSIVSQRLQIIEKFEELTADNALEKVLQDYLFDHLWLLDPGWDRATVPIMEKSIAKLIKQGKQSDRVDIKYRTSGSAHVIVELKRAKRTVTTLELAAQIEKYRVPVLKELQRADPGVELQVVCVLGREPSDWANPGGRQTSKSILLAQNARIVLYQQLIANAKSSYAQYLEVNQGIGKVREILQRIEDQMTAAISAADGAVG
ncbi:ATP-binding protein [Promicromonospora sp. NPDC023805]|uniref:BbrUII/HgiDII family restriction enzyme n=1 Tax=Promicromonospora sp. NPDC023805 TaxID=3154696 RepID=UPI0033F7AFAA